MKKGLSRSALEQFIRCPRCFYQQRRLGLKQPSMVPLTLAVATNALLMKEHRHGVLGGFGFVCFSSVSILRMVRTAVSR